MNVSMFIILLAAFSALTGLAVEAEKALFEEWKIKIIPNTLAMITACIIGWVGTSVYYVFSSIAFDSQNVVALILMGFASGLCSMVGYDKVVQAIQQINK